MRICIRHKVLFTGKQLVLARSLSLEPRKSFILIKYFWVLPVILNVLYKCKLDFVSILSSSFLRVNSPKNL